MRDRKTTTIIKLSFLESIDPTNNTTRLKMFLNTTGVILDSTTFEDNVRTQKYWLDKTKYLLEISNVLETLKIRKECQVDQLVLVATTEPSQKLSVSDIVYITAREK